MFEVSKCFVLLWWGAGEPFWSWWLPEERDSEERLDTAEARCRESADGLYVISRQTRRPRTVRSVEALCVLREGVSEMSDNMRDVGCLRRM